MIDKKIFSERFKLLRTAANMTMVDIAKALNLTKQSVDAWDKQKAVPSADKLAELADLLDTSIDYLCGRSETRERQP